MGKCEIRRIPYACVACTSIMDKAWISGIPSDKQERYKPVTKCNYWPVLVELNNWNIIELSSKSTSTEAWISGIPSEKQERYKPFTKCTYWQVLV